MVDGLTGGSDFAGTTIDQDVELLTGNTCPGTNLGTISKVELRAYTYNEYYPLIVDYLRPVFSGGDGDNHDIGSVLDDWSSYFDITSDTNAPSPWSWSDVQNLDCDVYRDNAYGMPLDSYIAKVEIRVTYTTGGSSSINSVNGLAIANVSSINGLAIADVKSWDGLE